MLYLSILSLTILPLNYDWIKAVSNQRIKNLFCKINGHYAGPPISKNIHNLFTNKRMSVYLDKENGMSLNTKDYIVKQISHLSEGVVIGASSKCLRLTEISRDGQWCVLRRLVGCTKLSFNQGRGFEQCLAPTIILFIT